MQITQQFEIGLALALGRQRPGEAAGLDQMEAVADKTRVGPLAEPAPATFETPHRLDQFDIVQHRSDAYG